MTIVRNSYSDLRIPFPRFVKFFRNYREQILANQDDAEYLKDLANMFRQYIYECGKNATGYCSSEVIAGAKHTEEHFHSRLGYAKRFMRLILKGRLRDDEESYRRAYAMLKSACRVHRCTPQENRQLSYIQNDPARAGSWRRQYRLAGIDLHYNKPVYAIDGIHYVNFTQKALQKKLGISLHKFSGMIKRGECQIIRPKCLSSLKS